MNKLIIIGAGGHGKVIADIAQKLGRYEEIVFLDDGGFKGVLGFPIIGKTSDVQKYVNSADFFVAIGDSGVRCEFIEKLLSLGANVPTLIHPSAIIGSNVKIGVGSAIMAGVVINPCAVIGKGVIVNTCSSIDHDCKVGDYCHISVGVHLAGTVTLGKKVMIGAGAIVKNNVNIADDCVLGTGAVVIEDVDLAGTIVSVSVNQVEANK